MTCETFPLSAINNRRHEKIHRYLHLLLFTLLALINVIYLQFNVTATTTVLTTKVAKVVHVLKCAHVYNVEQALTASLEDTRRLVNAILVLRATRGLDAEEASV